MSYSSPQTALVCIALAALCACSKPKPPEKERPPEPQAHGALREAVRKPIERAKQVDAEVQKAAEAQRAAIDAATGG